MILAYLPMRIINPPRCWYACPALPPPAYQQRLVPVEGLPTNKGEKGKSGGARVITNFVIAEETVFLISIYDKSEKENLTDKELDELLKYVPE
jgi:hypothetical protein